jgi:hypothetical protein
MDIELASYILHFRRVLFTVELLHKCFYFLFSLLMLYWTCLYVLRRTCRQSTSYETLFHCNILSKHHHHHHYHSQSKSAFKAVSGLLHCHIYMDISIDMHILMYINISIYANMYLSHSSYVYIYTRTQSKSAFKAVSGLLHCHVVDVDICTYEYI